MARVRSSLSGGREPLESSTAGRAVITVFLVVTLGSVLATNMPVSATKEYASTVTAPYLRATGLDQNWAMFSPNPRPSAVYIDARVEHADGSVAVWPISTGRGVAQYADYRWHKFEEQMWLDPDGAWSWPGYARWVAAQDRAAGGEPVRVSLVRRWSNSAAPGSGNGRGPWQEETFFSRPVVTS